MLYWQVLLSWDNIFKLPFEKNHISIKAQITTCQNMMNMGRKSYLISKQYINALWVFWYFFTSKRFKIIDDKLVILNNEQILIIDNSNKDNTELMCTNITIYVWSI